jgi:hypothetical protein
MTSASLPGAVAPSGPLQTAPGQEGNYQIISQWGGDRQVFAAAAHHLTGARRKGMHPHWSSRAGRRLQQLERLTQMR